MVSVSRWWQRKRCDSRNSGMQQEWKCSGICALQTKERSTCKSFPTREIRGRVGLCVLDAHARVFHCLHCSMLFLPLVWIMKFCPAVSEPHLNAPSQVSETNELPATTASSTIAVPLHPESFGYCKAPDVAHSSSGGRSCEQTFRAKSPMGCRGGSEQQWPKQRHGIGLPVF